uniref:Sodium-coupled monocarboxylate transporter 1 n=1 Tax=Arion vulgaris TaxID=1028688 RepID=A0A0B7BIN6_9EUPU
MVKVKNEFGVWDYVVFVAMLLISSGIGIFFAFKGGKQKTQGEYLMANRNMPILPVAISILVSFMSAILILGTPAEMYTQGTEFYISMIGMFFGVVLAALLFVPLLFPLKITSVFEYLELRFKSRNARLLGTFLMVISQVLYAGLATFAPSTAFEAVTGFPSWATILISGAVATFYTSIGGMKAVIWTDVFQAFVMVAGMLAIVIQGIISVGGISRVWEINEKWGRINFFNFDFNPTTRHTTWNLVIGTCLAWMGSYGTGQASVQRYSSLPTLNNARKSILLNMIGLVILITSACLSGIVLFAYYADRDCDPLGSKLVKNSNQLIPYFVMEVLGFPGVPGLFIACLFSGSLSTVSSALNALAAITWEDVLKPYLDKGLSEYKKTVCTKLLVVLYGCLAIAISFVAQQLEGTILQAAVSLLGAIGGPLTGMFVLGAFFPWANSYGVIAGGLCGLGMNLWLAIGSYVEGIPRLKFPYPNGTCLYDVNASMETVTTTVITMTTNVINTTAVITEGGSSMFEDFYKISYMWFTSIGILTVLIVGLIVSFITGANSLNDVPLKYQIPLFSRLFCCLPDSLLYKLNCCRTFQHPEDIRSDEKNAEIIVTTLDAEGSHTDEKSGVDNRGYNEDSQCNEDNLDLKVNMTSPSYEDSLQDKSNGLIHSTNGTMLMKIILQDSKNRQEKDTIIERF